MPKKPNQNRGKSANKSKKVDVEFDGLDPKSLGFKSDSVQDNEITRSKYNMRSNSSNSESFVADSFESNVAATLFPSKTVENPKITTQLPLAAAGVAAGHQGEAMAANIDGDGITLINSDWRNDLGAGGSNKNPKNPENPSRPIFSFPPPTAAAATVQIPVSHQEAPGGATDRSQVAAASGSVGSLGSNLNETQTENTSFS